jgi:hypothetical protein
MYLWSCRREPFIGSGERVRPRCEASIATPNTGAVPSGETGSRPEGGRPAASCRGRPPPSDFRRVIEAVRGLSGSGPQRSRTDAAVRGGRGDGHPGPSTRRHGADGDRHDLRCGETRRPWPIGPGRRVVSGAAVNATMALPHPATISTAATESPGGSEPGPTESPGPRPGVLRDRQVGRRAQGARRAT